MTTCPNCGRDITANDKFCSNCGTPLPGQVGDSTPDSNVVDESFREEVDLTNGEAIVEENVEVRSTADSDRTGSVGDSSTVAGSPSTDMSASPRGGYPMPPPVDFVPSSRPSVEEEWKMSSLGPPPKRKRSIWLYILIGILAVCLLSCVGIIGFSLTDTGQEWFENLATEAAQQATEAAD